MRKINGIEFTRGEMNAIWAGLDRTESVLESSLLIYHGAKWEKARRKWRKQAADGRSAQRKFHRVTLGLPE